MEVQQHAILGAAECMKINNLLFKIAGFAHSVNEIGCEPLPGRIIPTRRGRTVSSALTRRRLDRMRYYFAAGTFAPDFRASDNPMAMACFGFVTFFPLRPLLS